MDTASSGELVPNATTVKPITSGEIFMATAIRDAPRTNSSPPKMRAANPPTIPNVADSHWSMFSVRRRFHKVAVL